ncbi:hypothetical protein [Roseobacter fucihabitans]|nr:hypothetical protein [Roseobacter litoralis]
MTIQTSEVPERRARIGLGAVTAIGQQWWHLHHAFEQTARWINDLENRDRRHICKVREG